MTPSEETRALGERLSQIRFVPRTSLGTEILLATRHKPGSPPPGPPAIGTLLGLAASILLLGLLLYLLWRTIIWGGP